MTVLIKIKNVTKSYQLNKEKVHVLRGIDFEVASGDWLTITGPSGSGKTTLLKVLSGIEQPDEGSIMIGDFHISEGSEEERRNFRRDNIGYIFQDFQLFEQFNLLLNVMIPLLPYEKKEQIEKKAKEILANVNLSHREKHRPAMVSGGEKQRTAIARSLINRPNILLCDEPTGNLDVDSRNHVMSILKDLQKEEITIILVTHDTELSTYGNHLFEMRDGLLTRKQHS
ncbi:putative ABC transport system ATP-binding protein/macrolide transport system ATP-binding/permease protein [Piscibacillus halophilus]|uniref:Putative ABC transport system ATP-binding protein/macrolide transport system ATP-binding/permease protein n=1 Tax=Piscibacillus halophilus TaxID=571933 RepID=A0A1H9KI73_9BACI|nr:putative ABC transport system ATP-binding protein/macrolide transport system ATP-binding/permease protein [Piscibacillus halophilus]